MQRTTSGGHWEAPDAVARELREVLAIYRARLLGAGAATGFLHAVDDLDAAIEPLGDGSAGAHPHADLTVSERRPIDAKGSTPASTSADYCARLIGALDRLRAEYEATVIDRAAPGFGLDTFGEINVNGRVRRPALIDEIGRLERALREAGCPT